jgi:hypothetical protein
MCSSRFSFGDARPDLGVKEKLPTFGVLFLFFYSCREAASFNEVVAADRQTPTLARRERVISLCARGALDTAACGR